MSAGGAGAKGERDKLEVGKSCVRVPVANWVG
jgi:hypothetical protein